MTVGDRASGRESAAREERLLVLVSGARDRDLLADWLGERYDVTTGTPDGEWPAFDACLVDAEWYGSARDRLAAMRDDETAYIPVLLLVPSDCPDEWINGALQGPVDDVLSVPTRKRHLHARLSSVLRARRLSRDLEAERDRFRALTESATDAILAVGEDDVIRYANPAVERVFGHEPSEVVGEPLTALMPERLRDAHEAAFEAYLETSERTLDWTGLELTGLHADGHEVPIELSFAEYQTDDGHRFTGIVRDITERKAREEELRLTRRALESATVGISIAEASDDQPLVYVNDAFTNITGYEAAEALGRNCRFLQGPDTDEEPVAALRRAIEAEASVTVEIRNYRKDGEPFWNEVTIAPVYDAGEVTHYVGFQKDVTERKESRLELEATAEAFRSLYRIAADPDRGFEAKLDDILRLGSEYLGVGTGHLTRIEAGTQTVVASTGNYEKIQPGKSVPLERSYCRKTIETGQLAIQDAPEEGWGEDPGYEEFELGSYLGARVEVSGHLYGTVCFADREPRGRPFSESERALAELISQWVAFELDRREREEELRAKERQFEAIFQDPNILVSLLDTDGAVRDINETAMAYVDADVADVRGRQFAETPWFDDRHREEVREWVRRATDGKYVDFEVTLDRPSDDEYTIEGVFRPVTDAGGEVVAILVSGRDVTERKRRERELARALDLLEKAQQLAEMGAWEYDVATDDLRVTAQLREVHGLSADFEFTVENYFDLYDGEARERLRAAWQETLAAESRELELAYEAPDGEEKWLLFHCDPVVDDGDVIQIRGTVQDVTEPLEREREMRRYETMVESAPNPIYALDTEGRFTHVNKATVELTERSREEVLGAPVSAVFGDAEVKEVTARLADLLASDEETISYETSHEMPDGETRDFQVSVSPLYDDGEYDGAVLVGQDITEIRRHERRLSVLDRVFRHNVRNRLNVVAGHLAAVVETDDERVDDAARKALAAVDDLSELAESARRFQQAIRPGEASVAPMDVTAAITETVDTARAEHPDALFRTDLPDEAWARGPESFALAVEELLNNAVEHADRDPTVEVSVREREDNVEIRIADDGPGIPAMTRKALTRGEETPLEHALGLGLWLVRWTATNAGGSIDIEDNEPRGTAVVLRLPRA